MWSGFKEDLCTFQHELYAYRVNKSVLSVTLNSCFKNTSGIWSLIQNTRTTKNHNFVRSFLTFLVKIFFMKYNIIYNTIEIIINTSDKISNYSIKLNEIFYECNQIKIINFIV